MQRTIFITAADPSAARNILQTDFLPQIAQGARIVIVCPKNRSSIYTERFGAHAIVEGVELHMSNGTERWLNFFAQNAFRSQTLYLMQWRGYLRHESSIHPYFKRTFAFVFGWRPFRTLVRLLERTVSAPSEITALFEKYQPALVVSTMILDGTLNVPVLREARRRGIATAGLVRSWDNLTTYGFVRILPDHFFAQNQFIKEMAIQRHDIPARRIVVVGLPHYDAYVQPEGVGTREDFVRGLGLDANKKIFLYGAVGDFLFPSEATLAPILDDVAHECDAQVIFRPHPAHDSAAVKYSHLSRVRFDRAFSYPSGHFNDWDMTQEQERHLVASLHHCDALITASGTSMLVDGAVFDKPLVSVKFDGEKQEPYWFSIARFFDHADHSKALLATNGTNIVTSKAELVAALKDYEKDPSLYADGRGEIRALLAEPLGGASVRLASGVLDLLK